MQPYSLHAKLNVLYSSDSQGYVGSEYFISIIINGFEYKLILQ